MIVQKSYGTILLFLLFIEAALSAAPVLKADFNTKGDLSALLYGKALSCCICKQESETSDAGGLRLYRACRSFLPGQSA